ncbi:MAG: hypothetical protein WA061_01950 [Microgenomates group bacterium]
MYGYIVKDARGNNLTREKFWYNHEKSEGEEPYVFGISEVEEIREHCFSWKTKPAFLVVAKWTKENGTEVLGVEIPFNG